jgi:PA14 domain
MKFMQRKALFATAGTAALLVACQASFSMSTAPQTPNAQPAAPLPNAATQPAQPAQPAAQNAGTPVTPSPHVVVSKIRVRRPGSSTSVARDGGVVADGGGAADAGSAPVGPPTVTAATPFGGPVAESESFFGAVYLLTPQAFAAGIPDVTQLTPNALLFSRDFAITERPFDSGFPGSGVDQSENFVIRYEGALNVVNEGDYTLRLVAADAATLTMDDLELLKVTGINQAPKEAKGKVHLLKGNHAVRLDYAQGPKSNVALQLFVSGGKLTSEQALRGTL